ncbi:MAG: FAD-dependent monooxygenase [Marinicella sp.]
MPETTNNTEIAIVGGGLVGMALALSLAQNNISSVLIESMPLASSDSDKESFDDRTLVVNPASQQFCDDLGLWSEMAQQVTAIDHVHVSNQGRFGVVQFDKNELNVPQLAHVIAAKTLAKILHEKVRVHPLVQCLQPAKLLAFKQHDSTINLSIETEYGDVSIAASLMVAADGVKSGIRSQLNLATEVKSYKNTAVICNIRTDQAHRNRSFERLTRKGPMALLPFKDRFGFVWSMETAEAEAILSVDEQQFLALAQAQFGYRAGRFEQMGRRSSYPLYQVKVPTQHAARVVLMGNAAHAVSPVSAQGLNLAIRGIGRLSPLLSQAKLKGKDLGANDVLQAYQEASIDDQQRTLNFTDDLMTWFKIDEPLVNAVRSIGLVAINSSLALKKGLFNTAGGLR